MRKIFASTLIGLATLTCSMPTLALSIPVTFTKLNGVTGGSIQGTAIYQASLSGLGLAEIQSLTIRDSSGGFGGAVGQFSGFDLDGVILANVSCLATDNNASCVNSLSPLSAFDYSPARTFFSPGTQRAPVDPKLFGTDVTGNRVDNTVATLGAFDGESTTAIPGANGFVSLGDFGSVAFNLVSPVSTTNLYLYIGEVGDNGEVAGSTIEVSDEPARVPEPTTLALLGLGIAGLGWSRRRIH